MSSNPVSITPPTMPAARQQALVLLNSGLTITSSSTPALNGTYACGNGSMADHAMQAEINSLLLNANTFVDGATSVDWPDISGAGHTFTEVQFRTLANAIDQFVVACFQYAMGITTTAPSANATIP